VSGITPISGPMSCAWFAPGFGRSFCSRAQDVVRRVDVALEVDAELVQLTETAGHRSARVP